MLVFAAVLRAMCPRLAKLPNKAMTNLIIEDAYEIKELTSMPIEILENTHQHLPKTNNQTDS
jgi:hypothetical protein